MGDVGTCYDRRYERREGKGKRTVIATVHYCVCRKLLQAVYHEAKRSVKNSKH